MSDVTKAPGPFRQAMQSGAQPSDEDCRYALYAHLLGAIVGLFTTGVIFPAMAPTFVLLFQTSRHPFLLFHINQTMWFQAIISLALAGMWIVFMIIYFLSCGIGGLLLLPVFLVVHLVLWLLSVVLPLVTMLGARRGEWSRYPFIGDMVLDQESPLVVE